jgi:O-methyltransferase
MDTSLGNVGFVNWAIRQPLVAKISRSINTFLITHLGLEVIAVQATQTNKDWFDRCLYFQKLLNLLVAIDGDVVECGVASGCSLAILANIVRSNDVDRHVWGFDTWRGLPSPSKEDLDSAEGIAAEGVFGYASIEMVIATLKYYGFDDPEIAGRVTLVKGLFSETLTEYSGTSIALLHIDADLYNSYIDCLEKLWPKISIGGIAAFDEYHVPEEFPGAKKAVDEFLSQLPSGSAELHRDTLYGRYYAVKTA